MSENTWYVLYTTVYTIGQTSESGGVVKQSRLHPPYLWQGYHCLGFYTPKKETEAQISPSRAFLTERKREGERERGRGERKEREIRQVQVKSEIESEREGGNRE